MIGAAMNQFLTDLCKMAVGRLRPHFWDLCRPNVTCGVANAHTYYEEFTCLRTSHPRISADKFEKHLMEAR